MTARRLSAFVLFLAVLAAGNVAAKEADPNTLTPEEKTLGFELLFNGRDFESWAIEDGTFAFRQRGGGLIYR